MGSIYEGVIEIFSLILSFDSASNINEY